MKKTTVLILFLALTAPGLKDVAGAEPKIEQFADMGWPRQIANKPSMTLS